MKLLALSERVEGGRWCRRRDFGPVPEARPRPDVRGLGLARPGAELRV